MFEAIYGSPWHHPYSFWAVGGPLLALLLVRARAASHDAERVRLAVLLIVVQLAILADAWLTAPKLSPLHDPALAESAGIAFVILGDFRYFVLFERYGRKRPFPRALIGALALSLIVPIGSLVIKHFTGGGRVLFMGYEIAFAALAIGVRALWLPRLPEGEGRSWIVRLTHFEIAQYLLWATADVIILAGGGDSFADAGYLLRLVPNSMYYIAFVPFAWLTAPKELRP